MSHGSVPQTGSQLPMPTSVSPALIPPAPMAHTAILPASAMSARPQFAVQNPNWTQIPGTASYAAAAPDGSLWVLSDQPSGADKYIWHYVSGTWTNNSGLASRIAVAPNGTLYAINSGGGTFSYSGGTWTALGGGASDIAAAKDGSIYVLSNGNSAGSDQAIWHYTSSWAQVPGSGVRIAGAWDSNTYTLSNGTVAAGGLYILNSAGGIYYENPNNSFVQLPGAASAIAPTTVGGVYVLGYPANSAGNAIYYYDLTTPGWTAQAGSGVSISAAAFSAASNLYVIGASGGIYSSPLKPIQHLYVADAGSGGNVKVFGLPITSGSTPTATFGASGAIGIAANGQYVVTANNSNNVLVFTQPVTSASVAAATFTATSFGRMAFRSSGVLAEGEYPGGVSLFSPPFTNSTTASSTISTPNGATGIAIDASDNIYANDQAKTIYFISGGAVTTTATGPSGRFYRGMAVSSTQLFACSVTNPTGQVDVYNLPLSSSSAPAATITTGVNGAEGCALDLSGNLYVGNVYSATVTVYAPPFSSSSAPTATLTVGSPSSVAIFDLAIGP
jgi:hypothetical protein